jgi:membrane protease YdiL (CAAX protease family)
MGSVIGICALPIVLTAIVYPLTAQPFKGDRAGAWLISPLAQELLFTGFIYGRLDASFPGTIHGRLPIRRALLLTAVFFMLWHVPNFEGMGAGYVMFQLAYTLIGGAWGLLARQLTGSILPGVFTHMAVNFVANMGW